VLLEAAEGLKNDLQDSPVHILQDLALIPVSAATQRPSTLGLKKQCTILDFLSQPGQM